MMVKEKNNLASIFSNKCEILISCKGSDFETSDKVFLSTMSYH